MAANITDKFTQATNGSRPAATTLTALHSGGDTTMSCSALTGWPTATAVHFIVYTTDASGNKVAGSQTDWKGVVSGTSLINCELKAGTDSGYSIGAIVECAPTAYWAKDMADGMTAEHEQDGTHGAITPTSVASSGPVSGTVGTFDSLVVSGTATSQGWTGLGAVPTSITSNGNHSFDAVFTGDISGTLSKGMRTQWARSVVAPTQCASLNGTTQYFTRASGSLTGHSFTDDFAASAVVEKTAYNAGFECIQSRYNGTSGWALLLDSSGKILLQGVNAAAGNYRRVVSNQAIPLDRPVHIAAQLDMSTWTATSTTNYIMIDGVDVPVTLEQAGTNPTSIVQAGNYEIGSWNGGLFPFLGKISQVAIYSAKVTQATMKNSIDRPLAGNETSLISAYSLSNSVADLNANANTLTAQAGATTTTTGGYFGNGGVSTTLEYGLVTKVSVSTDTTVSVQVPAGCQLPTTGGVSSVNYSTHKTPYGWPGETNLWAVAQLGRIQYNKTGSTANTWYNPYGASTTTVGPVLKIPTGSWNVKYSFYTYVGSTAAITMGHTLSTSTSAAVNPKWTTEWETSGGTTQADAKWIFQDGVIKADSMTSWYLLMRSTGVGTALYMFGERDSIVMIEAVPVWL